MANEYLQRTPTSTGNRKVWTLAGWIKLQKSNFDGYLFHAYSSDTNRTPLAMNGAKIQYRNIISGSTDSIETKSLYRDAGSWLHFVISTDTTQSDDPVERVKIYINGKLLSEDFNTAPSTTRNSDTFANASGIVQRVFDASANGTELKAEVFDWFLIDGQALTPDVFGFYKQGKGYISVGSTQATDFRPGQWVPKTPRVIKTEINRRGGFGVNGFYLPMNDSRNFGADFHGDPNSIITLNEKLPQPRVGVATTASVGLGYTDALRSDPYAANLVLALPFVSGGLNSGFGDYAPSIKGSGTQKSFTANGNVAIANTASYYGSGAYFDGNGDYLRTSTNISDFQFGSGDFTIETWLWKSANGVNGYDGVAQLGANGSATDGWFLEVSSTRGYFWYVGSATYQIQYNVSPNTSQWNHLAVCRKGNTTTMYLNGVAVGVNTNGYTIDSSATKLDIGGYAVGTGNYWFNGYLQDLRVYKGVAKYTGGFDVPRPYTPVGIATWRAVPDTTANNFATLNPLAERQAEKGTITAGNLRYDGTLNQRPEITSTIGVSTGKWYYEIYTGTVGAGGDSHFLGICNRSANSNGTTITIPTANVTGTRPTVGIANRFSTQLALYDQDNTYDISGTSGWWVDGSVVGFAFDINNNSVSVYKNGVLGFTSTVSLSYVATGIGTTIGQGAWSPWLSFESSASRTPASNWVMNFGQNPTFSGNTTAGTFTDSNGKGLFKYQPPSGFLALCEDNLPTPAISDPGKHFKTMLWTGTGKDNGGTGTNGAKPIVGIGFTPDLVWIKNRDNAEGHWWWDSVRGFVPNGGLRSNLTDAETNTSGKQSYVSGASADGFSITENSPGSNGGEVNYNGRTYVTWCWRAGAGTTSTNTNGSIPSVVSVNQDAGFSIVSYTGTGANATVGHGLGKTPGFIIIKRRSGLSDWAVYHKSIGTAGALILNSTTGTDTNKLPYWNDTSPTITTFGLGNGQNVNASTSTYVAYCWAEIEGFSKFGSYVGNGNADGPMIVTGFKPAWVMFKNATAAGNEWFIYDTSRNSSNVMGASLLASSTAAENGVSLSNENTVDYLSNGFKLRTGNAGNNQSGQTIIFAAFAESPFTTANAK